jgi:hypothetical protein
MISESFHDHALLFFFGAISKKLNFFSKKQIFFGVPYLMAFAGWCLLREKSNKDRPD